MADRISVRISDEISDKLNEWSKRLGVTKSQLGGMAITAGLDAILRAVSPVDSISADKWAELTVEIMKRGQMPELPTEQKGGSKNEKTEFGAGKEAG